MSDLQKEINNAFIMISSIPVVGDSVDRMAKAREHLRRAYQMAGGNKEEKNDGRQSLD